MVFVFTGDDVCACVVESSSCIDLTPFATSFIEVVEEEDFDVAGVLVLVFLLGVDVPR